MGGGDQQLLGLSLVVDAPNHVENDEVAGCLRFLCRDELAGLPYDVRVH